MTGLKIEIIDKGENRNCFPELNMEGLRDTLLYGVVLIENGTEGGKPSLMFVAQDPTGKVVTMQTTGALFDALAGAYAGSKQRWAAKRSAH